MSDISELFSRNKLILGEDYLKGFAKKHVAVFGLGGVGGFALESLARMGVGEFTIVDFDKVTESNINRQIIALHSTIGEKKVDIFKARLLDINPKIKINQYDEFYTEALNDSIFSQKIDYVVDAIDTAKSKIQLLKHCYEHKIPVITSLGAGNRLDPTQLYICDISEVSCQGCNFLKNILRQLSNEGITSGITAIYSREKPIKINGKWKMENGELAPLPALHSSHSKKTTVGSLPFTPAVAGYYMGYYVMKELGIRN